MFWQAFHEKAAPDDEALSDNRGNTGWCSCRTASICWYPGRQELSHTRHPGPSSSQERKHNRKVPSELWGMKTAPDNASWRGSVPCPGPSDKSLQDSEPQNACKPLQLVPQDSKQNRPQVDEATRERPALWLITFR